MVYGIGLDIVDVKRVKHAIEKGGERFVDRVFTEGERRYCLQRRRSSFEHFAARFAAKEAVLKAFGLGWGSTGWKTIEVINDETGAPRVVLHGKMEKLKELGGISSIFLSLSHTKEVAVACVVVEK